MANDFAGNTRNLARNIGSLGAVKTYADAVGAGDPDDYYRFTLDGLGSVRLGLEGLSAGASLEIMDANGNVLKSLLASGVVADSLRLDALAAGTYYIHVSQSTGVSNYKLSASAVAAPVFSISGLNAQQAENAGGAITPFTFVVTRTGDLSGVSSVGYSLVHGDTNAADFTGALSGTVVFAQGEDRKIIHLDVRVNNLTEKREGFRVVLDKPVNGVVVNGSASGLITSDTMEMPDIAGDSFGKAVEMGRLSPAEKSYFDRVIKGRDEDVYKFSVDKDYEDVEFNLRSDVTASAGVQMFCVGSDGAPISWSNPISRLGGNESARLRLGRGTYYVTVKAADQGDSSSQAYKLTARAYSGYSYLSIDGLDLNKFVGTPGHLSSYKFLVTRSGDLSGSASVGYTYWDWSNDIVGRVSFAPGEGSKEVSFEIGDDVAYRMLGSDGSFSVRLIDPVGASLLKRQVDGVAYGRGLTATYPATDLQGLNDVRFRIEALPSSTQREGSADTKTTLRFWVSYTGESMNQVSVDYRVLHETTDADDFIGPLKGTVQFAPGETGKYIEINVNPDQVLEGDETFLVSLSNPVNGSVRYAVPARGVIVNDDGPGRGGLDRYDGAGNTLTEARDLGVFGAGGATVSDYVDYYDPVDWYKITTTQYGVIKIRANNLDAPVEIGFVRGGRLDSVSYYHSDSDALQPGTYYVSVGVKTYGGFMPPPVTPTKYSLSVDVVPLPSMFSISAQQYKVVEGSDGQVKPFNFLVKRSGDNSLAASVDYAFDFLDSKFNGGDVVGPRGGTVFFAPGEAEKIISIGVVGDQVVEGDEYFSVFLKNPVNGSLPYNPTFAGGVIVDDDKRFPDYAGDTRLLARDVGLLNDTAKVFKDYVESVDLDDFYRFSLDREQSVVIRLAELDGRVWLRVFNESNEVVYKANPFGYVAYDGQHITDDGRVLLGGLKAGNYYVDVSYGTQAPYTLSMSTVVAPKFSIKAVVADQREGTGWGTVPFTFRIECNGSWDWPTSVGYALVHGTTDSRDFTGALSGRMDFTANGSMSYGLVTFNVNPDDLVEGDETFSVVLVNPTGGVIDAGVATGVIRDDDSDRFGKAKNLGLAGSAPLVFSGSSSSIDMDAYYRFSLGSAARLKLELAFSGGYEGFALFDANKNVLAVSSGSKAFQSIDLAGVAAGTYYVRVYETSGSPNYTLSVKTEAPKAFSIHAQNADQPESYTGYTPFTFVVSRTGDLSEAGSVAYKLINVTTSGADFVGAAGGLVSFAAGQATQTITINVVADALKEWDERFNVVISNPVNGVIDAGVAGGVIRAGAWGVPDGAGNSLASAKDMGLLGASPKIYNDYVGGQDSNDDYSFTLDGTRNLRLALSGLSANADLVLMNSQGAVLASSTQAGNAEESIRVDALAAGTYYLRVLQASGSTQYTLSASAQPVPVSNFSISALDADRFEGDSGTTPFTFVVTRSGDSSVAASVNYALGYGDSAVSDFVGATSGLVSFAAGETRKIITLSVQGDTTPETDESFKVVLQRPVGGVITNGTAWGLIRTDDGAQIDKMGDSLATARNIGNVGYTAQTYVGAVSARDANDYYRFSLSSPGNLRLNLISLSANANLALFDNSGTLLASSENPGASPETLSYDGLAAGDYYARVYQFSGETSYVLTTTAVPLSSFSIAALTADRLEGNSAITPLTFQITRSGYTSSAASVSYRLVHGTTNSADFVGMVGGVVNFTAGQTSQIIELDAVGDLQLEDDEQFSVVISNPVNGTIATGSASGVIRSDDAALPDTPNERVASSAFVFRTLADTAVTIADFSLDRSDKIQVVASNFGLTAGSAAVLRVGSGQPTAVGTGGQFLYGSDTGSLWFDQDGSGAGQAVLLAHLNNRPALSAQNIGLVAA